ncbi:MAG: hypothetical protein CO128_06605 [Ignavibacteriales bacterium CG_4_9_14_3_um_filter_30_11]|nr:MAG: hypothetical protein CO128_06605 [Ignavibacteriales bacterium CG_4_9_14_3_um_filter_30_11]
MNINDSLEKLFSLHNFGIKLGIDNIKNFLFLLNNPHLKLKTIHIAGSNGKGSSSAFIASILQEHKFKIGLYTSPHFIRFNERIKINGNEIDDQYISEFISKHFEYIIKNQITFFEATTALAFCFFRDQKVDFAVIETGLGGRLDATNVLNPLCSVITGISLEHTHILGKTIKQIAEEKAGIIKRNSKVITAPLLNSANQVMKLKCKKMKSELIEVSKYISKKKDSVTLTLGKDKLEIRDLPLAGNYQNLNAALASLTVYHLLNNFNKDFFENGLMNVIKNTSLSGRYEYFNSKPDVIFDSAHNPDGVRKFLKEFRRNKKKYNNKYLLFSVLKDKSVKNMLKSLRKEFDKIFLTTINFERVASLKDLKNICKEFNFEIKIVNDRIGFIHKMLKGSKNDCLVVLGSMYLIGQVKKELLKNKLDISFEKM